MIVERPGASNDRDIFIGNLDQEVDLEKYRENYDKINWGEKEKIELRPCLCSYPNKIRFSPDGFCRACGGIDKTS